MAHPEVDDAVVDRVQARVLEGMGLVVLHSGHFSKIFQRLMGTTCNLVWRETGERERVWVVDPGHPIAAGLDASFVIEREEMYGEPFDVPAPDRLVLVSWFGGGEIFRSGGLLRARPRDGSSISGRATRPIRPTSSRRSGTSSPTPYAGRRGRRDRRPRQLHRASSVTGRSHWSVARPAERAPARSGAAVRAPADPRPSAARPADLGGDGRDDRGARRR